MIEPIPKYDAVITRVPDTEEPCDICGCVGEETCTHICHLTEEQRADIIGNVLYEQSIEA